MSSDPKYVVFKTKSEDKKRFILIDKMQTHSQAARHIAYGLSEDDFDSISAGFVNVSGDVKNAIFFQAYGHSSSLKSCDQPYEAIKEDSAYLEQAHGNKGLFFTFHGSQSSPSLTILGENFTPEEIERVFRHADVVSQGWVKLGVSENHDVVIESIEHAIDPQNDRIEKMESGRILSLLGTTYW